MNSQLKAILLGLTLTFFSLLVGMLSGCAKVKPYERETLADPIMQRVPDKVEEGLKSHNLPRREGSAGGTSGSGGGCGC